MSFSRIKTIEEALKHLGIKEYPTLLKYDFKDIHIDNGSLSQICQDLNNQLVLMPNVEYANEAERELLCQVLVSSLLRFLNRTYGLGLGIKSKHRLAVELLAGYLDFCVYRIGEINPFRVLTIFETKKDDLSVGAGQLIVELDAVSILNGKKAYGFITNFLSWQMYTVEVLNNRKTVYKYEQIFLTETRQTSIEKLSRIVYAISFSILEQHLLS